MEPRGRWPTNRSRRSSSGSRRAGSAFPLIEADCVEVLAGDPQPVEVPRDDGSTQRIYRCPTARSRFSASTRGPRRGLSAPARSTSRRRSRPTSTSLRGRSCRGSSCPTRCRRSRSITTGRRSGPPPATSGSKRSSRSGPRAPNRRAEPDRTRTTTPRRTDRHASRLARSTANRRNSIVKSVGGTRFSER